MPGYDPAMVSSDAATPARYIAELPDDRRKAIKAVRAVIRANLPKGYRETMDWGMINYEVPLKRCPDTYNGKPLQYAALASQKNHMAVYLSTVYADPDLLEWFTTQYRATGKKLDMGKSCVRFRTLDDLPLELIGETIAKVPIEQFIASYHRAKR